MKKISSVWNLRISGKCQYLSWNHNQINSHSSELVLGDGLGFVAILYSILLLWLSRLNSHMWSAGWYPSKANHLAMQAQMEDFLINCISFLWVRVNGSPALTSTVCCVCRSSCAFVHVSFWVLLTWPNIRPLSLWCFASLLAGLTHLHSLLPKECMAPIAQCL